MTDVLEVKHQGGSLFEMPMRGHCTSCKYFVRKGAGQGECHARPPHPILMPGQIVGTVVMAGVWPPVKASDSCGLYTYTEPSKVLK